MISLPSPPASVPDGPLGRQRLRLLGALDQIALIKYEKTLDAQCDELAAIIFNAYQEWKKAGSPPSAQ